MLVGYLGYEPTSLEKYWINLNRSSMSKPTNFYVDHKRFLDTLKIYKRELKVARKAGTRLPQVPEYIGEYFDLIAKNLAHKNQYNGYSYKDEMISDGVENCIPGYARVTTEDGMKTMKEIVDMKYSGRVLSMNKKGIPEWNRVTHHWAKTNTGTNKKPWVMVNTKSPKPKLICTPEHKCMVVRNPLRPVMEYVEAKDSIGTWVVREFRPNHKRAEALSYGDTSTAFLVGTLLGDGYINKEGQCLITHGDTQLEYINTKQKVFGGTTFTAISMTGFGKGKRFHRLVVPPNAQTKMLRKLLYPENGPKIVGDILDYVDEKALAFWYMDDGCKALNAQRNPFVQLSTQGFTKEENLKIAEWFDVRWGIKASVIKLVDSVSRPDSYIIRIGLEGSRKFWGLVGPYIIPCMKYKVPEDVETGNYRFGSDFCEYALSEILGIVPIHENTRSKLYDIEVENNHNFFVNNTLVSNCLRYFENYDVRKSKTKNPFSYFTTIVVYAFWRRIATEHKQQYTKYKLFAAAGAFDITQEDFSELPDELKSEIIQNLSVYDNMNDFIAKYEEKQSRKKSRSKKVKNVDKAA